MHGSSSSPSIRQYKCDGVLARISHHVACARMTGHWFYEVFWSITASLTAGRLRWPRPRGSPGPVRAHAPSNVGPAMLSVASTRTGPGSSAIIAARGEKCGLVCRLSNAFTLHSCPTANRACAQVPVSTAAHPRLASENASPNGVPTVNVFPRRYTSLRDRGFALPLDQVLWPSAAAATCWGAAPLAQW